MSEGFCEQAWGLSVPSPPPPPSRRHRPPIGSAAGAVCASAVVLPLSRHGQRAEPFSAQRCRPAPPTPRQLPVPNFSVLGGFGAQFGGLQLAWPGVPHPDAQSVSRHGPVFHGKGSSTSRSRSPSASSSARTGRSGRAACHLPPASGGLSDLSPSCCSRRAQDLCCNSALHPTCGTDTPLLSSQSDGCSGAQSCDMACLNDGSSAAKADSELVYPTGSYAVHDEKDPEPEASALGVVACSSEGPAVPEPSSMPVSAWLLKHLSMLQEVCDKLDANGWREHPVRFDVDQLLGRLRAGDFGSVNELIDGACAVWERDIDAEELPAQARAAATQVADHLRRRLLNWPPQRGGRMGRFSVCRRSAGPAGLLAKRPCPLPRSHRESAPPGDEASTGRPDSSAMCGTSVKSEGAPRTEVAVKQETAESSCSSPLSRIGVTTPPGASPSTAQAVSGRSPAPGMPAPRKWRMRLTKARLDRRAVDFESEPRCSLSRCAAMRQAGRGQSPAAGGCRQPAGTAAASSGLALSDSAATPAGEVAAGVGLGTRQKLQPRRPASRQKVARHAAVGFPTKVQNAVNRLSDERLGEFLELVKGETRTSSGNGSPDASNFLLDLKHLDNGKRLRMMNFLKRHGGFGGNRFRKAKR